MNTIPISMLRQIFDYDPDTGHVTWKIVRKHVQPGQIAGALCSDTGYQKVTFCRKSYRAHRIAWALTYGEWPTLVIDHINGIRNDNRLCNLRLATQADNVRSMKKHKRKKCNLKGVTPYFRDSTRYLAQIFANGKHKNLGIFDTEQEAHNAYCEAASALFGEFFNPDCTCHQSGVLAVSGNQ